jgi:glycosyltransferase involved in cell wall biosynthesis
MPPHPGISIIVCTRNRAAALAQTLAVLGGIAVPAGGAELIVVDNASTDDTPGVVGRAGLANMQVRYVHEPRPGVSHARNTGLTSARGDIILFTDDDVRPAEDWAEKLTAPLRDGRYDAVAGRIVLASHLARTWIRPEHALRLAVMDGLVEGQVEIFCANMGIRRAVLEKVPAFDPELGPGALGFGEDTLFSRQLALAGYRLGFVEQAVVVHHPDASRLQRSAWLDAGRKRGRTWAYLLHHWRHEVVRFPRLCWLRFAAKLLLRRIIQPPGAFHDEGCPLWEMSYVGWMAQCRQFLVERRRPRNYAKRGLVKLSGPDAGLCASPPPSPIPGQKV